MQTILLASSSFQTSEYLRRTSREYAIYTVDSRGIPHVSDGLKNVQRVVLWVLRDRAEKIKTYALGGLCGYQKLYSHGEASLTGAIGLLAAPYKNNVCLIHGLGQFGSRKMPDKDGIGAPRYTEVQRSKAAEAFLYCDLDLVPMVDNYDGSNQQPTTLLPLIPVVLLNGAVGVATGWSTEILPRSLKSLVEATKDALLGNPIATIPPYYSKYDITVRATNKPNQWEYTGQVEIIDTSTLRVTEIPPGVSFENFLKRLTEMEDGDLINGFTDRSAETIDITIKLPRGLAKDWKVKDAVEFLKLVRELTTERIVVIDWKGDSVLTYDTAEQLVIDFAKWRLGWYTVRFQKLLNDTQYELKYWTALAELFAKSFPTELGKFADKAAMKNRVVEILAGHVVSDDHLERILGLSTYRWTKDFEQDVKNKIADMKASIQTYTDILASPDRLKQIYIDELDALKTLKI